MKKDHAERLVDRLPDIDEDLLALACEIDNAKKLKLHIRKTKPRHGKHLSLLRRVSLIAACLALAIGLSVTLPFIRSIIDGGTPIETDDPWNTESSPDITEPPDTDPPIVDPPKGDSVKIEKIDSIESFDMVNYYSALKILTEPSDGTLSDFALLPIARRSSGSFQSLSATGNAESDVICYQFDRDSFFSISQGTFFQLAVTDENSILASLVGVGTVDVAITSNDIDPMITFRNGDRYFSCLRNGTGFDITTEVSYIEFSTHKQTDGFHIIKDMGHTKYYFYLTYDGDGKISEFYCTPWKNNVPSHLREYVPLVGKTYTARKHDMITIATLEEYFSTDKYLT